MKNVILYCIISVIFILNSCHKQDNIPNDKAVQFCLDNNGTVVQSVDNGETLCQYLSNYTYDDGEENYNTNCEINTLYNNPDMCSNLEEEGINTGQPLVYTPDDSDSISNSDSMSIRTAFYTQVKDILEHLNNTGYTHRKDGQFILHPGYAELTPNNIILKKFNSYNLFLDCSGFVGYYVVQGIAKELYHKINTCYHSSRPLAADFADTFKSSQYRTTDKNISEATLLDLTTNSSAIVWGRVPNIKNAKPGDIIVYKHSKNIEPHGRCNNTVHDNTGHVLFIMEEPSIKKNNEWLVRVADSTTAPHSADSRYTNTGKGTIKNGSIIYNKSFYADNEYTAWTKRYKKGDIQSSSYDPIGEIINIRYSKDDWLELCDTDTNNTFHRRCSKFNYSSELKIHPQTSHINSSTGIGIGYIYISEDMKHYRVKKGADKKYAEIYIGRPVKLVQ